MTASPRAVFERLIQGISDGHWAELADLYAEDAVVAQPFAIPPRPPLRGREAIRAHFTGATAAGIRLRARDIVVHETADPEVVVAEFTYDVDAGRGTTSAANIQVLRVRDGLIRETRDYHDHLALAHATGRPAVRTGSQRPAPEI
jgi:uncharacterized protein